MALPYFPLYPTDFKADTSHLTTSQMGVYFRMIMKCWTVPSCTIPNDIEWILDHTMSRRDNEEDVVADIKFIISEFFKVKKGRLHQKKILEIHRTQNEKHKSRVQAGKKGAEAKALKNNNKKTAKGKAKPKQPEPEPEPDNNSKLLLLPAGADETPKKKRKHRLPEGWTPKPLSQEFKEELQITKDEYQNEFRKFKDHAAATGRSLIDWDAGWRNWLRSDYRRPSGSARKAGYSAAAGNGPKSKGLAGAAERAFARREQQENSGYRDITPEPDGSGEILSLGFNEDDD